MTWKDKAEFGATWMLVICAIVVTALFVRRELIAPPLRGTSPHVVKNWRVYATGDEVVGPAGAHDTVVVFSDFQCPYCARLAKTIALLEDSLHLSLRVIHRNLPITSLHPYARAAAIAGICASRQGRFEQYYRRAFAKQDSLGKIEWDALAAGAGIADTGRFRLCMNDASVQAQLAQDSLAAQELKIGGTPTLLVGKRMVAGALPVDSMSALLKQVFD